MPKKRETSNGHNDMTCPNSKCGRTFSNALRAANLGFDPPRLYDACPYCLTEVSMVDESSYVERELVSENERANEVGEISRPKEPAQTQPTEPSGCTHNLGYLSARPSKEPIPDECMVCTNIVQCMLKKIAE